MSRTETRRSFAVIENLEARQLMAGQQLFFENFEAGGAGWSVDQELGTPSSNPWVIGNVTSGPGFARSGTKAAFTGRPGTDAYLASPVINLPAVNQYNDHLYMRYDQWTDYRSRGGSAASIPVVREYVPELGGWGPWNVIDPNTEAIPQQTKTWGNVGLDLTQFGGSKIQLGFHHNGFANGAPGWYIDNVSVTKEAVQKPWHGDTSFENGFEGWTTTGGIWDIGTPNSIHAATGSKVAGTGLVTSPIAGDTSSLVSPAFMLPANPSRNPVTLSFNSLLDKHAAAVIRVEFQFWMPSTGWSPVNNLSGDVADPVLNLYQPDGKWKTFTLPLTNSFGGASTLPFRLLFTAGIGLNNGRGWFIDDVKLNFAGKQNTPTPTPTPTPTARPEVAVFNPFGELTDGVTSVRWGSYNKNTGGRDITFTIRNTGGANLTVGAITLDKNVGFTVVKQPASNVAAGGTTTFTLRLLTTTAGTKSAAVRFATNDADENPFNFNISGMVLG